jgi:hypothetical protein
LDGEELAPSDTAECGNSRYSFLGHLLPKGMEGRETAAGNIQ